MQYWKKLNIFQKALIGIFVVGLVILMPELMPLLDMGGIELIFGFVVLQSKNVLHWLQVKYIQTKLILNIAKDAFVSSALAKPKTFVAHAGVCSAALILTGSLVLTTSFLLPVILTNGMLI